AASVDGVALITRNGDSLGAFKIGDGSAGSLGASDVSGYMIEVSLSSGSVMNSMKGMSLKINGSEYIGRPDNKDA